ncbi:MAG: leucine--tRNA ligase [Bacteroidota bacterium]
MRYPFKEIEQKWQRYWDEHTTNLSDLRDSAKPFYNLMMFPYPSAEGLHVGNVFAFTGSDIFGRTKRLQGYDVFEPIGFDAFGIHSENYAIRVRRHPNELIPQNVRNFTRQLKEIGLMLDWNHSVNTTDPEYYRWTQWIFLQMYKAGLAYRAMGLVNWCPECKTVLADEQVIDGECERHPGVQVLKKELEQWFFKITDYAERLHNNLRWIDWSETTKRAQQVWIGRSEGAEVDFPLIGQQVKIRIFTTRMDTLFGATYMVLSPEHPLVGKLTTDAERKSVQAYVQNAKQIDGLERIAAGREKSGVFIGAYALNPTTEESIPIWVADYVLMDYGTGAIMAVPANDERDYEFAQKYGLLIKEIHEPLPEERETGEKTFGREGILMNSGQFNGMTSEKARDAIRDWLKEKADAVKTVNYRLRDWCISRQRYWGPPIPMLYCERCGIVPVPEEDLPVLLPEIDNFMPDDSGKSPLARIDSWMNTTCPKCGGKARRETDVNDNFLDSAWYFLRYPSTDHDDRAMDPEKSKKWLPVDMYIGGNEHAVLHLMYTRFLCMALHDMGHLHFEEPFKKFRAHGLIISEGAKMSKSKGNIVNPDEYIDQFGADAFRMYLMFLGPYQEGGDFLDTGLIGVSRFLERVYDLVERKPQSGSSADEQLISLQHETVKRVTDDIEALKYNTAIARLMEYVNVLKKEKTLYKEQFESLALLLAPLAPHLAEEMWERVGHRGSIFRASWPSYDESKIKREEVIVVLQINGKIRDRVNVPVDLSEEELEQYAHSSEKIRRHLDGKKIKKTIVVKNKLVNLVI